MQRADSEVSYSCCRDAAGTERLQRKSGVGAAEEGCVSVFRFLTQPVSSIVPPAVLKSLNEFYDDARSSGNPSPSPNEAEFRAYNILTHLRDPDIIWSCELLPPSIFSHTLLQRALAIHRLAQKSNIARGERASQNAFSRFFKLVAAPETPYLFACILSTHFNDVRRNAVDALRMAFLQQHSAFPLRTLAKVLGCDDEEDARSVCEQLGVVVRADERGKMVAELHKQAVLKSELESLSLSNTGC